MARVFIGVGSNIDPERNIRRALELLGRKVSIIRISTFYRTEPLGRPDQPSFYNGVIEVETDLPPRKLKFGVLRRIEGELGRERGQDSYAPRTIDLDILLYDDIALQEDDLAIPDPDIADRPFLALPLYELGPDLAIPGMGMIARVVEKVKAGDMQPLAEFTDRLRETWDEE